MIPQRVRVQGDYFHGVVPDGAVYVGRQAPGLRQSFFHNPFRVGVVPTVGLGFPDEGRVRDARHAVILFEEYVSRLGRNYRDQVVDEMAGRDVACWCRLPELGQADWCHGMILLHLSAGNRRWP